MKKNSFTYIISLILFLISGQQILSKNIYQKVSEDIIKIADIRMENQYFIRNNFLWYLDNIEGKPSGKIINKVQKVDYVYKKIDLKELSNDQEKLKTNTSFITNKRDKLSGNGRESSNHSIVGELMSALSGRISYGEYYKETSKKWF